MRELKRSIWPYRITIKYDEQAVDWCEQNIGRRSKSWYMFIADHKCFFAFTNVDDFLVFKLKWGYNGDQG